MTSQAAEEQVPDVVEPFTLGPTWKRGPDGRFIMPEYTLGWHCLAWTKTYLQHYVGKPWQYTPEQARLTLWWYAMDPETNYDTYFVPLLFAPYAEEIARRAQTCHPARVLETAAGTGVVTRALNGDTAIAAP